ncbi:acyl carrier protein [Spongiactinospora rosea]|uniref:Acyl carrier protein n=1 Tax=Spongiactinospora rosea TaxID=2248750 RepID=A0A366M3R6_9ACTN|nr:phosphopantetheine-binding protein [Spongiactinospora rosea]RBQ20831.1 acyl carrier protein [Spongiactinospora rosea]
MLPAWDARFEGILRPYLPFLAPDEALSADAELRDLGLDSLGIVELLTSLEHVYEARFRDELLTVQTFATPARLWQALSAARGLQLDHTVD